MDQFYQVLYGPTEDKLKHCGAAWLGLSLIAKFAGSDLTGFIGLLAILSVVTKSDYLLFLLLALAPLSLLLTLVYLWREPRTFWLVLLQLLYCGIQGLAIWLAWQWFQELNSDSGYQPADNNPSDRTNAQGANSDPFQAYVPPRSQQSTYQQPEQDQQHQGQPTHPREDKSENLI